MKRMMVLIAMVAMVLGMALSGCSGNGSTAGGKASSPTNSPSNSATGSKTDNKSASDNGKFELGSTPIELSFYGNYDWMTKPSWGNDPVSKWIQDNKKVKINLIQSGGAAKQKFNTMIASGNLPNVIMLDRGADVEKLYDAGKLVPLDPYLDKYPNLKKYAGTKALNMLRSADGKLYQFPNWYTNKPTGNNAYVINTKIYQSLGSPKLETLDDLYNYLKMVKEKYPDIIPLEVDTKGQGIEKMISAFGEDPNNIYMKATPKGSQLTSLYEDPNYQQLMIYANKLFQEKLIDQDTFTETSDQVKEKLNNGQVAVSLYAKSIDNYSGFRANLKKKDPEADYKVIWPLHADGVDKNNVYINGYNDLGWNVNVITKGTKNPEAVFAFLDWLTGPEGQATVWFGPKGLYWDQMDSSGFPQMNDKWNSTPSSEKTKQQLTIWNLVGNTGYIDPVKSKINSSLPEDKQDWVINAQNDILWKTSKDLTEFINLNPAPDSPEGIAMQAVSDMYSQYFAKMMFAKNSDEVIRLLQEEDAAAKKQGYDKLLTFMTQKWQANLKQMNQ